MNMSRVIQMHEMASPRYRLQAAWEKAHGSAGPFSSALFCLWLSMASLVVWVDFGSPPAREAPSASPMAAPAHAIKHD
jgi:hypothetical protein